MSVLHVTNIEEYLKLITEFPCVVKFTATWCFPCRRIAPVYEKLAEVYGSKLNFLEVDVDSAPLISKHESVDAIPLCLFYNNGKLLEFNVRGGNEESLISNVYLFHELIKSQEALEIETGNQCNVDGTFSFHDEEEIDSVPKDDQ